MFISSSQQLSMVYGLLIAIAVALPMSETPSTASQTPFGTSPTSSAIGASSPFSPVIFIENAGQWPEAARFQVWDEPSGTEWLIEDTTALNPTVSLFNKIPDGCVQLTPMRTSVSALQEDRFHALECPYLALESVEGSLSSISEDVPQPPLLISPANEERLDTLLPVLRINTGISGVDTSVRYEYSVNSDFTPGDGGMGVAGPRTVPEWSFQLGSGWSGYNLQPNTRYYWHARTGYGNWRTGPISWGPYSPTWSFTTGSDGTILPGPELVSPSNNSDVYTLRPILQWHTLAGTRGFFVQASPVGGGPGYLWFSEDIPSDKVGFWTDLPPNSSWDWKVRLRNDYAWGDLSSIWRFTIRQASISGRVTDVSGVGIPSVTVWAGSSLSTTTDANGDYTFTELPAGTYNLRAEKTGYAICPHSRPVTVPPDASGQDFTGLLAVANIAFCPSADGYKFSNSDPGWGVYPSPPASGDFSMEDMRRMFGDQAVCLPSAVPGLPCSFKPSAWLWYELVNSSMNKGHCAGMAATSLRFFKNLDHPADFQANATNAFGLDLNSRTRRNIAYYHVEQSALPILPYKLYQQLTSTPARTLDALRTALSSGVLDPVVLVLNKRR